jgi:chromosome partitioning protein
MRIITVAAAKGGTGKTTTAVTLAHALALAGRRILVADADPRGHVALHFGLPSDDGLAAWLCGAPAHAVEVRPGLHVLTSGGAALARLELRMAEAVHEVERLRVYLRSVPDIDLVLIDCAPGRGPLATAALLAADEIILPVGADFLGLAAAEPAVAEIAALERRDGTRPRFLGLLPTFHDPAASTAPEVDAVLAERFGGRVLASRVRFCTALRCAPAAHGTVYDEDPLSEGALDYALLAREIERSAA